MQKSHPPFRSHFLLGHFLQVRGTPAVGERQAGVSEYLLLGLVFLEISWLPPRGFITRFFISFNLSFYSEI